MKLSLADCPLLVFHCASPCTNSVVTMAPASIWSPISLSLALHSLVIQPFVSFRKWLFLSLDYHHFFLVVSIQLHWTVVLLCICCAIIVVSTLLCDNTSIRRFFFYFVDLLALRRAFRLSEQLASN